MPATHLVITAFLSAWATLAVSVPKKMDDQKAKLINESLDRCVDPCDDFYAYACGGWIKKHPIPESRSTTGTFRIMYDELQETLRSMLGNMTLVYECQNITDKAAVAYNACMAVPTSKDRPDVMLAIMNISGLAHWPITKYNTGEMFENCSEVLNKTGFYPVLSVSVGRDSKNLSSNIIQIDQLEFLTVGRNQLIHPEKEENKKIIDAYKELVKTALNFMRPNISDPEVTELSDAIVDFEGQLANMTAPPEERRDFMQIYNRTTIGELERNFTNVWLLNLLNIQFSMVNITLNVNETVELYALKYYNRLDSFLRCADPDTLYNYAGLKVMLGLAAQVSEQFRKAFLELTKAMSGVVADRPRWEKCVAIVNGMMPEIVGLLYVQHKFTEEAKREVQHLAQLLMVAFKETLQNAEWMDSETRKAAEKKLIKMGAKIGYPDWLYNTTYLEQLYQFVPELCCNCTFAQMLRWTARNHWLQQMLKLRQPYDKDAQWLVGPAVVNAFYNPSNNEMAFKRAAAEGVWFREARETGLKFMTPASLTKYIGCSINYGAIGMIVGHEMTHGFDDTGSQFDADGALKQWWTNRTRARFKKRAECFEYQYGNITDQVANMSLNGKNTLGENIADNGGLRMAFRVYDRLLKDGCENDTRLAGLEDLSGKQLFFIANAMVWCSSSRSKYLKQLIQYDPHSPERHRVNVPMGNMEAFRATFKCSSKSTMIPKKRCALW